MQIRVSSIGGASAPVAAEGTSRPAVTAAARVVSLPTTDDRETAPLVIAAVPEANGVDGARLECGAGGKLGGHHISPPQPRMDGSMGAAHLRATAPADFIPTPTTTPPASFFVAADGDVSGTAPPPNGDDQTSVTPPYGQNPTDFNLGEFLALANRVVDVGDVESVAALADLKRRWVRNLGMEGLPRQWMEADRLASTYPGSAMAPPLATRDDPIDAEDDIQLSVNAGRGIAAAVFPIAIWVGDNAAPPEVFIPAATVASAPLPRPREAADSPQPLSTIPKPDGAVVGADSRAQAAASVDLLPAPATQDQPEAEPQNRAPLPASPPVNGTAPTPPIYIGTVQLNPTPPSFDKIAVAFHNSTRKTLSYVPPTVQNGEIVVRPSLEMIRDGSKRWSSTALGTSWGKNPIFLLSRSLLVLFGREFGMLPRHPMKWEPGMVLRKLQHTQVPAWIKMRHLPVELWTPEGLSVVASGIGKPLYPDSITRACTRLDFARVCIMLDITSTLPKHVVIMVPKEDGSESACKVDIEYEWLPPKCTTCISLGHHSKECPSTRPRHPPVSVYVPKPRPLEQKGPTNDEPKHKRDGTERVRQPLRKAPLNLQPDPKLAEESRLGHSVDVVDTVGTHADRGKAIVIYNAFDMLTEIDGDVDDSKGPISSPTTRVDD
ncbi:UNVERIFIED_CONTAM: hypothetical protein Sradi_7006200 [Sesamum radiatum]|uniref:DUF4283 domain-containing protein n=1 Tax=Sesamum radiatum TaxID=300843 RepID=A0AAW2JDB9_SESRA